ncbi:hypothetical protein BDF19DRAFT_421221 [Syncephalis fuscata]|nr:hypothetical protein BDF19DRAFT_421221 [Syncephalis fuscata]
MIGNSLVAQVALATGITLLTAVAPIAFIHHLLHLFHESPLLPAHALDTPFSFYSLLHYWLGVELLFYVYFVTTYRRLQRGSRYVQLTDHERSALFYRCCSECGPLEKFFPGWFKRAEHVPRAIRHEPIILDEIYRENAREWLAWGFFGGTLEDAQARARTWKQLNWMLDYIEENFHHQFPKGYNTDLTTLRLNLDPVKAVHRPCFFYALIFVIDGLCKVLLYLIGFRRYGREPRKLTVFAASLAGGYYDNDTELDGDHDIDNPSEDGNKNANGRSVRRRPLVTYWYRPGRPAMPLDNDSQAQQSELEQKQPLPIVITHGIGIGIAPYFKFVWRVLVATNGSAPIYLVELPHVSMRFYGRPPTVPETTRELDAALVEHGHSQAVFVGHSLGSAVVAGMCRSSRKRVAAAVLVDPICFLLHLPAVAYGFVHRRPTRANERFVAFFASRELFISRFISRSFHWYHSCMWADDLPSDATVFLSQNDLLVPSREVSEYFNRQNVNHHMMPLDHAQFMLNHDWESKIVQNIADYATGVITAE